MFESHLPVRLAGREIVCSHGPEDSCILRLIVEALTKILVLRPHRLGKDESVRRILTTLQDVWACDDVQLLEVDQEDTAHVRFVKHYLTSDSPHTFSASGGIARLCVIERAYFIITRVDHAKSVAYGLSGSDEHSQSVEEREIPFIRVPPERDEESVVFYPLILGARVVAVIKFCDFTTSNRFSFSDVAKFKPVAQAIANLLDLHRVIVELDQANQTADTSLAESQRRLEKLKIGERLTYQFLTATSHLHDLAGIIGGMASDQEEFKAIVHKSTLSAREKVELTSVIERYEGHRKDAYRKIRELLHDRPKTERLFVRPNNIKALIDEQFEVYERQFEHDQIRYKKTVGQADIDIPVDEASIRYVIRILVNNALRALSQGAQRPKRLRVHAARDERTLRVMVRDNGVGIEPDLHKRIFEAFFTTDPSGSGIGLFWAKKVIEEHHRGRLFLARSFPQQGATFVLELPLTGDDLVHA